MRLEDNLSHKERYHCYSLDAAQFESAEYSDGKTPESILVSDEYSGELQEVLVSLTDVQKDTDEDAVADTVKKAGFDPYEPKLLGMRYAGIAGRMGCSASMEVM